MRDYVIRRVLLLVPTLIIVSLIIFLLIRLIPGNIIDLMVIEMGGGMGATGGGGEVDRAAIEKALGLDVSLMHQYGRWMGVIPQADGSFSGILQGDLGNSLRSGLPVATDIALRWPVTLQLGLMGMIIAQLIALPIGVYSAIRQDKWGDYIGRSFAILCISIPAFWVGTMAIVFPSIWWGYMPPIMLVPFTENPIGNLQQLITPAVVLGMAMCGGTMRMTRTMMLEVLRQDYIRTAWAKGLMENVITLRHALKNALIPVVTIVGMQVPILIGGTVIIEQIFAVPGMGRLIIRAILLRDYTIVSGAILILSLGVVSINLIVDLTYGFLDPRVRYK